MRLTCDLKTAMALACMTTFARNSGVVVGLLLGTIALSSCSNGSKSASDIYDTDEATDADAESSDESDAAEQTDTDTREMADGTAASATDATTDGEDRPMLTPSPAFDSVHFVGRVDDSDAEGARFAWSGTGLRARFSGTSIGIRLGGGQQYTVVIDGEVQPKYTSSGDTDLLAEGLDDGEHEFELYRRTEASQGESVFYELEVGSGELLDPPPVPGRRIELVGDSISCGYGNEGEDMNCSFSPDTENHYLSYGAIAARAVDAELSTVAWSGKGVVCNYGDGPSSCFNPMPTYYDRILPDHSDSLWDFSRWEADAVVVNLGTNDLSTSEDPDEGDFEAAYHALLDEIRSVYPDAFIFCAIGPLLSGADLTLARWYIGNVVDARVDDGDERIKVLEFEQQSAEDGYGCDWHPSLKTHELMAETLADELRAELDW